MGRLKKRFCHIVESAIRSALLSPLSLACPLTPSRPIMTIPTIKCSGCSRPRPTYPVSIIRMSSSCPSFALRHHPRLRPFPLAVRKSEVSRKPRRRPAKCPTRFPNPRTIGSSSTIRLTACNFNFRAGRNVARTVLVVSLAVAVSALFYAMLRIKPQPPKFIFAMVGVLDFFLILVAIRAALSTTRIVVGNGVISWRRFILGIGKSHELQISDVDSILAVTSVQQASSSGGTLYSLRLKSKSGKNYTLVDDIESRQEARWIVSKIEKRAGLHVNTQVEINNSFYGPPPQPNSASTSGSVVLGRRPSRNRQDQQ